MPSPARVPSGLVMFSRRKRQSLPSGCPTSSKWPICLFLNSRFSIRTSNAGRLPGCESERGVAAAGSVFPRAGDDAVSAAGDAGPAVLSPVHCRLLKRARNKPPFSYPCGSHATSPPIACTGQLRSQSVATFGGIDLQPTDILVIPGQFFDVQIYSRDRQSRSRRFFTACKTFPALYRQHRQAANQPHTIPFPGYLLHLAESG